MSNFNSEYEKYYKGSVANYTSIKRDKVEKSGGFFVRRLTLDLIGTLILFLLLIICRSYKVPQTTFLYTNAKKYVNYTFDYKTLISKASAISLKDIEGKVTNYIDTINSKLWGKQSFQDKIKSQYVVPVKGEITSKFGERINPITKKNESHKGVDIGAKEGTEVVAAFNGSIKDCGSDTSLGNYISIDHGDGVTTKYGHLSEIKVKKGDKVLKNSVIGKVGSTGESTAPHLHFEFLVMEENKDPMDYIAFSNK